jgi:hypothetical protein
MPRWYTSFGAACNLNEKSAKKFVPAVQALGSNKDGAKAPGKFNYRSVIGMLMHLANNTRLYLAYAVNQCARFSNNPKVIHEQAIKYLARYLIGTCTKGMYIRSTNILTLDCFVDADFAGLWNVEHREDPACVRSRTGFVITLGNVPVIWTSKLQSEIASSTISAPDFLRVDMSPLGQSQAILAK